MVITGLSLILGDGEQVLSVENNKMSSVIIHGLELVG